MRNATCLAVAGLAVLAAGCADVNGYGSYPGYGYGGGYSGYGYGGGYSQPAYYGQSSYYQPAVVTQTRYVSNPNWSNPNWQNGQSSNWSQWHRHHDHDHDGDDYDRH